MPFLNWVPKHILDILRHTLYEKVNGKWQTCKTTNKANASRFVIYPTRVWKAYVRYNIYIILMLYHILFTDFP